MMLERRAFVKAAAWSVPVIAAAVALPAAAASGEPQQGCIEFTHTRPHLGDKSGTLYCTIGVKETCGATVGPITLNVTVDGRTWSKVIDLIPAYGEAGPITCSFDGIPADVPLEVVFQAFEGIGDRLYIEAVKPWQKSGAWW